jgi:hypothetical protein
MTTNQTSEAPASKTPNYIAYHVRESKGKNFFTRVGVAWRHRDGNGLNIEVSVLPIDGRIMLRVASEKKD